MKAQALVAVRPGGYPEVICFNQKKKKGGGEQNVLLSAIHRVRCTYMLHVWLRSGPVQPKRGIINRGRYITSAQPFPASGGPGVGGWGQLWTPTLNIPTPPLLSLQNQREVFTKEI